jgi:hypothetical protein
MVGISVPCGSVTSSYDPEFINSYCNLGGKLTFGLLHFDHFEGGGAMGFTTTLLGMSWT